MSECTDMYTLSCIKEMAGGKLPYSTGSFGSVLCDDLREVGWRGERLNREGIYVYICLILICCTAETSTIL